MKRLCTSLAVAAALLAATLACAAPAPLPAGIIAVPLAVITNDRDSSVSRMDLMVSDAAGVSGIYMETSASTSANPAEATSQVYPLAGIESHDGVVLGQGQGVKAIFLRGSIAGADGKGSLTIRYLTNGVFRHWAECRVDLRRQGAHDWRLVNAYDGQPVHQIEVKTWALGISTLANICPVKA